MRPLAFLRTIASALFRRSRLDAEMDEELRAHIASRADDLERSGLPRAEAERRARIEFGGVERFKQECREAIGTNFLETLIQDFRIGLRLLHRSPGFAAIAIITLALGVGANTTMFSLVNGILLRPLPYTHSGQLVNIWVTQKSGSSEIAPAPADYFVTRARARSFQQVALFHFSFPTFATAGKAEGIPAAKITASLFPLFQVQPVLGRGFTAQDEQTGAHVAILSHTFWQSNFGGKRNVLEKTITLDENVYTVIGVMPRGFDYPGVDVWLPLKLRSTGQAALNHDLTMIARLKPGVTIAQAQAGLRSVAELVGEQYPRERGFGLQAIGLLDQMVGSERALLLALLGAAGFVLLIACANIAGLLVARGMRRQKEIAIRLTLGATRRRIVRLLLAESLLLALGGGALGLAGAFWAIGFVRQSAASLLPRTGHLGIDARVFCFTLSLALLAGLLAGLLPSFEASKLDLNAWLKEGVPGMGVFGQMRRERLRFVLVTVEVALATVLLVGSALFLRSFYRLTGRSLGFDPHNVVEITIPSSRRHSAAAAQAAFFGQVLEKIRAVRGVSAAAVTSSVPFTGGTFAIGVVKSKRVGLQLATPSPGYFHTLKIPLIKGRVFDRQDSQSSAKVAVVNQAMARRYWPHENPLGHEVSFLMKRAAGPWRIVGVVGDTRSFFGQPVQPEVYLPFDQLPPASMPAMPGPSSAFLLVKTRVAPASVEPAIRRAIWSVDSSQLLYSATTMERNVWSNEVAPLFRTLLLAVYSGLALLLALIGVYGVVAFWAGQRTHEIGVRLALGAQRENVLGMVLRQGALATVVGLALGLGGAWGVTRVLRSYLYHIRPTDPLSYAAAAAAILLTALLACYLPARRASKLDPASSLRYE